MIYNMIYDMLYDVIYNMVWYLFTEIGFPPGDISR